MTQKIIEYWPRWAKKVFQIQSFVTREVGAGGMAAFESLTQIRSAMRGLPTQQQMVMTSINNGINVKRRL